MKMPDWINARWIDSLTDAQLIKVEAKLHATFRKLEKDHQKETGVYELSRAPAPLMYAWDRWAVVSTATRARGLKPEYKR
jgi:hypothetical protein